MSRANVPAFTVATGEHFVAAQTHGLTIREHFAAMMLASLLTHVNRSTDGLHECEIAVQYANALIQELAK
jgi:hypothetical protein